MSEFTGLRFLKVSCSLCYHCLHLVQNSDFLKKRKLQRPTCCFSDLDIWITFWGRYKYFFVKGKNPNISKSSIKVNLLLRIFKRSWKLKELSILTTSINSSFCAQIFKEDSQSQTLLFFYNINYNQSIVTEFSNRAPQLKEPFSCYLPIACCFFKFFSHSKQNKLFSTKIISLYSDKADMILHHRAIMKT